MMPPCQIQIPTNVILWMYRIGIVFNVAICGYILWSMFWR